MTTSITGPLFVRALGGLERWFFFMDRHRPNHFSIAASLAGSLTSSQLVAGLARLQVRHPLLNVSIDSTTSAGATFLRSAPASVPLRVVKRETEDQWRDLLANEAAISFDTQVAPLVRVTLIYGSRRSELILTVHHSVADGMGLFFILRDLIAAMSGEELKPLPLSIAIEELRSNMLLVDPEPHGGSEAVSTMEAYSPEDVRPSIESIVLTEEETESILDLVRHRRVTFHSVLTAALVLAGRAESANWRKAPVRVFTPINIRKSHSIGDSASVALGAGVIQIAPDKGSDLWELAQQAMDDLAYFRRPENEFVVSNMMGHATADPGRTHEASSSMGYDLILTNPGLIDLKLASERIKVTQLWGPSVLIGFAGEQSVSALTLNGQLFLTHISTTPISSLLSGAVGVLLREVEKTIRDNSHLSVAEAK